MRSIKEWTTEDYIKNLSIIISSLSILLATIIFKDIGTVSAVFLFSVIIGVVPYFIFRYLRVREIAAMEYQLPSFLRDLAEENKSGMSFLKSMEACSRRDYGRLSKEIKKMYYQMTWGIPLDKAIKKFSDRVKESNLIRRSMNIILEAYRSGGDMISTMESIASDTSIIKEAEKERKSAMGQHIIIMYLIYFTFIGILIALTKVLTSFSGGFSIGSLQKTKGICEMLTSGMGGAICTFFFGICNLFGLGSGTACYYRAMFLSMALVQGLFSGLVAGQIGEESVFAGIKHSLIMLGIGFAAYLIAVKVWIGV